MTATCLSVRRALYIAPEDRPAEVLVHIESCPSCGRFAARCAKDEQLIRQAAQLDVPVDLGASILMSRSFSEHPRRRLLHAGIAAGLACLIALGAIIGLPAFREHQLTSEVLTLIEAADYALENREPLGADTVATALAPVGFSLVPALDQVSFAGRCLVQGILAGHLVLRDQQRPVTVFLIPNNAVPGKVEFSDATWSGILLPEDKRGTIAVLAPRGTDMGEITRKVKAVVRWPA